MNNKISLTIPMIISLLSSVTMAYAENQYNSPSSQTEKTAPLEHSSNDQVQAKDAPPDPYASIINQVNLSFKLNRWGKPIGWKVYEATNKTTKVRAKKRGKVTTVSVGGSDIDFGIYHLIDLSDIIDKTITFSAWFKTKDVQGLIVFWGYNEEIRTYVQPSTSWQHVSVTMKVNPKNALQRLFLGANNKGYIEVRDPTITIAD